MVIVHIKGEEKVVADVFSHINGITMPSIFMPRKIDDAQQEDKGLKALIEDKNVSLKLQSLEDSIEIY